MITEYSGWKGTWRSLVKPPARGTFSWRSCGAVSKSPRIEISLSLWAALPMGDHCCGESHHTRSDVPLFPTVQHCPLLSTVFWCLFVRVSVGECIWIDATPLPH